MITGQIVGDVYKRQIPGVWYGWNIFPTRRPAWYILPTARMNRRKYLWATFLIPVSYTHLDVYKRQPCNPSKLSVSYTGSNESNTNELTFTQISKGEDVYKRQLEQRAAGNYTGGFKRYPLR